MNELLVKVKNLLESLEFCISEGDHCSDCPSCHRCMHKHGDREGHAEDCELAAVLAEVKEKIGVPRNPS